MSLFWEIEDEKISPSTKLMEIITDYQLDQIFPGDCLSQLDLVLYQAGEYICRQGSEQNVIPYFLKGRLKIVHSLENGSDTILKSKEKPGLLGEIELPARSGLYHISHCRPRLASRPTPSPAL